MKKVAIQTISKKKKSMKKVSVGEYLPFSLPGQLIL